VLPSRMRGDPSSIPAVFKNLFLRNQEFRTINCLSFGIELNFFEFKLFFDAHASTSTCYFLPCFFHLSYARGEYSCTSVITPFVCTHLSSLLFSFRQKLNLNSEITRKKNDSSSSRSPLTVNSRLFYAHPYEVCLSKTSPAITSEEKGNFSKFSAVFQLKTGQNLS